MNATRTLDIPLDSSLLVGKERLDRAQADAITKALTESKTRGDFVEMIAALIDVHRRAPNNPTGALRDRFEGMQIHPRFEAEDGTMVLHCENFPQDSVIRRFEAGHEVADITAGSRRQIACLLRDLVFQPNLAEGATQLDHIKAMVSRAGLLDSDPEVRRVFVWGGHGRPRGVSEPAQWYEHAKALGYELALRDPKIEFITGCGPEIMKAPFKGALNAYRKQDVHGRHCIGLSEPGILSKEAPNEVIDILLTLPNIEMRMVAFIMLSMRGIVCAGGAGTVEEVLQMLSIKTHPNNQEVIYPFDLVEPKTSGYMERLDGFLATCLGPNVRSHFSIKKDSPLCIAEDISREESRRPAVQWREDLFVPSEAVRPFEVSFDTMEALQLSRDREPYELLCDLRKFFSGIVHLTVKNPGLRESWGDDLPKITGDEAILNEVDSLVLWLAEHGRIPRMNKNQKVYRV